MGMELGSSHRGRNVGRLRVFQNRVMRRIFGPKRHEVTGEWRRLYNEELSNLHPSSNVIQVIVSRRMRWGVHVAHMGERRSAYKILVGKPEAKRPLGRPRPRPRHRLEDNIRIDLQEVGWEA